MKAILFDFDGTLVDTSEGITKSVQYSLDFFGVHEPELSNLTKFIGPPLVYSFTNFYGFSEEKTTEAIKKYRERYTTIGLYESELYPGVRECIEKLREQGYRIGLASSKPEQFCRILLDKFNVIDLFDEIVGATPDGSIGTKEQVLEEAFRRWSDISSDEVCLIGDTLFDVEGANQIGIPCIVVSYGFGKVDEMLEAGAVASCDRLTELPDIISKIGD